MNLPTESKSKSKLPYLIRALHEWIVDCEMTPYLLVTVSDQVRVPADYVSDGRIVLNVSPAAIRDFLVVDSAVSFAGRFGGRPFDVYLPMSCVQAIYARETGEGMVFEGLTDSASVDTDPNDPDPAPQNSGPQRSHGHLQVIK